MLDTADRQEDEAAEFRTARLTERLEALRSRMRELEAMEPVVTAAPDRQVSLTDPDARPWRRTARAPVSSATMCRRRSIPIAIWLSRMR
jgi:hypothetical protein